MLKPRTKRERKRRGGGLIVVMVLLAVMAIYLVADSQALFRLRHTLNEVEAQQVERLEGKGG